MTTDNQIFTSDELRENQANREKLIGFIQSKTAIAMIGAGCSFPIYPLWREFGKLMLDLVKRHHPDFNEDTTDLLTFANKVKEKLGKVHFHTFVNDTFEPKKPLYGRLHKVLCQLPFQAITTTNYDILLENAQASITHDTDNSVFFEGGNNKKIYDFLRSLNYSTGVQKKRIIHLHGKFDIPESIILCGNEYAEKYGFRIHSPDEPLFEKIQDKSLTPEKLQELLLTYGYEWPIRRKLLWTLLASRRLVFFGFSMNDPFFIKMLEFVQEDLNTFNTETHFMVLRITLGEMEEAKKHARYLKDEYGIISVFFEDDSDGKGLENFILELGQQLVVQAPKPYVTEDTNKPVPSINTDIDLKERLLALSKKQARYEN